MAKTLNFGGYDFRVTHRAKEKFTEDSAFYGVSIYSHYRRPCERNVDSFMVLERKYSKMVLHDLLTIDNKGVVCGGSWSYTYKVRGTMADGNKVIFVETRDNHYIYIYDLQDCTLWASLLLIVTII